MASSIALFTNFVRRIAGSIPERKKNSLLKILAGFTLKPSPKKVWRVNYQKIKPRSLGKIERFLSYISLLIEKPLSENFTLVNRDIYLYFSDNYADFSSDRKNDCRKILQVMNLYISSYFTINYKYFFLMEENMVSEIFTLLLYFLKILCRQSSEISKNSKTFLVKIHRITLIKSISFMERLLIWRVYCNNHS